jgi:hypothetical protein
MAERAVLRENYSDDAAERRRVIHAQFASLLVAAEQRIIAHIRAKILAIDPGLSHEARLAAIARLHSEQADALSQLRLEMRQQKRRALQATRSARRSRFKRIRRDFTERHVIERAEIYGLLGIRPTRRLMPDIAFDATLDLVERMMSGERNQPLKPRAPNFHMPRH